MSSLARQQRGFTLIELILGIAITGIVLLTIAVALSQMFVMNGNVRNHTVAVRQVQNAGYWISRDALGAQTIYEDNNPATSDFLTLSWSDWTGIDFQSVYYFDNDDLHRSYYIDGGMVSDIVVASDVNADLTTFIKQEAVYTLTISATVDNFPSPITEVRTYEILPRPPPI